jgi:hypothetical protein
MGRVGAPGGNLHRSERGQGNRAANWAGSLSHEWLEEAAIEGGSGYEQMGVRSSDGQGYDWQNR